MDAAGRDHAGRGVWVTDWRGATEMRGSDGDEAAPGR